MARVPTLERDTATADQVRLLDEIATRYGSATNMKRTLAHAPVALDALMTWYPLHDAVREFLEERGVRLFCHAVSSGTECLLCTTYFRRELIEAGEDPSQFRLTAEEDDLVALGTRIAHGGGGIRDDLFARVTATLTEAQVVTLVAFGALMVATNIVNNTLDVSLDDGLLPFVPSSPGARV